MSNEMSALDVILGMSKIIRGLESDLDYAKYENGRLKDEIKSLNDEIADLKKRIDELEF